MQMRHIEFEIKLIHPIEVKTIEDYNNIKDKIPDYVTFEYIQNNGGVFDPQLEYRKYAEAHPEAYVDVTYEELLSLVDENIRKCIIEKYENESNTTGSTPDKNKVE